MKTRLIFLALLNCLYLPSFAQTNVSGIINSNSNWTISGSPYVITGNVLLNSGYTLTIEAGVEVKVSSGKSILIDGELLCLGTLADPIVFTSGEANPNKGDWGSLKISNNAQNASYSANGTYLNGSKISNTIFEFGGGSNQDGTLIIDGAPFIDSCVVRYSMSSGIFSTSIKAEVHISHTEVYSNQGNSPSGFGGGISLRYSSYPIYIENNNIHNNAGTGGLKVINNSATGYILNNRICNNTSDQGSYGGGVFCFNSLVEGNTIHFNSATYGGGICADLPGNRIKCNSLLGNTAYEGAALWGRMDSVINNQISLHTSDNQTIKMYEKSVFELNQIANNRAPVQLLFYGGNPVVFRVYANSFSGNFSSSSVVRNQNSSSGSSFLFHHNNFISDSAGYLFENLNGDNTNSIDATNNYWNSNQNTTIQASLFDFNDDFNHGLINYSPYNSSPDTLCPMAMPVNILRTGGSNGMITWDAVNDTFVGGYMLHWGVIECGEFLYSQDLGNTLQTSDSLLGESDTFAISAYRLSGHNSQNDCYGSSSAKNFHFTRAGCTRDSVSLHIKSCISYTPPSGKITFYQSGDYTDTLKNSEDCDSILYIQLEIFSPANSQINITTCDSLIWNNRTIKQSGTYYDTLLTTNGCDSVVMLNLDLNFSKTVNHEEYACKYFTWNNRILDQSGTYYDSATSSEGCDSITVLDLTITQYDTTISSSGQTSLHANQNGVKYQWVICENNIQIIDSATSQDYTPTSNGSFACIVYTDSCSDTTECIPYNLNGQFYLKGNEVMLFPNPSGPNVQIMMSDEMSDVQVSVYSSAGQLVWEETHHNARIITLQTTLSTGVFIIELSRQDERISRLKWVIK